MIASSFFRVFAIDSEFTMKAEIQFFMTAEDAEVFINLAEELVDSKKENGASSLLIIGDCQIVYVPSVLSENILMAGSIAIDSGGIDAGCKQRLKAEAVYKKLRKWIKNNYSNRLCTWTEGNADKVSRVRDFWLGPDARQRKESDSKMELRLSFTSSTLFDLAPDMNVMGDITPKTKKPR